MASEAMPAISIIGTRVAAAPALIVASLAGVKVKFQESQDGVEVPPFGKKFDVALELSAGGTRVGGTSAVVRMLAAAAPGGGAEGASCFQEAQVDAWMEFAERELDFPEKFDITKASGGLKGQLSSVMASLGAALAQSTFLVGPRITAADVVVACSLQQIVPGLSGVSPAPAVARWFGSCLHHPAFQAVLGNPAPAPAAAKVAAAPQKPSSTSPPPAAAAAAAATGGVPKIVSQLVGRQSMANAARIAAHSANFVVDYKGETHASAGPLGLSLGLALLPPNSPPVCGQTAVLRYICAACPDSGLEGTSEFAQALVDSWVEFARSELPFEEVGVSSSGAVLHQVADVLRALEAALRGSTFLVGHRLTLGDVAVATRVLALLAQLYGGPGKGPEGMPNLLRWLNTCAHLPAFQAVLGGPVVLRPTKAPKGLSSALAGGPAPAPAPAASKPAAAKASKAAAPAAPAAAAAGAAAAGECKVVAGNEGNPALQKLEELGISFTNYSHPLAFTVEEQEVVVGHLAGELTKNLVLKDKKHGMFVVTVVHDRDVNTTVLAKLLKLPGKANMRFGTDEHLAKLGVKAGSVGPLCLLNDTDCEFKFVLDKELLDKELVNSHPLRNDRTTALLPSDILKYAEATGHPPIVVDWSKAPAPGPAPPAKGQKGKGGGEKQKAPKPGKEGKKAPAGGGDGGKNLKKETLLCLTKTKEEDFAGWYQQVITYSEMIDYSDISGCYVLRPWSFSIWEAITRWFDDKIKELGVQNAYFPLFVSKKALETEKDHVEGFAPEVAWVTKSGETDLQEHIAIRPTSETIMYPFYADWIRSHRDLPLLLNQWSNVVRWEFKYPTPFLRSREFLWQEGHTVHATYECADKMVMDILDLYARVYEELLAVPVVKGQKTEEEKFAGGMKTTTVEAFIHGSGRAIQGATSHHLGQNFAKMFHLTFEDEEGKKQIPWQTSWGLTTRTIGVMVMVHGDDKGLVLPPRVANLQAVIIPIVSKSVGLEKLKPYVEEVEGILKGVRLRVRIDDRKDKTAGWKYNHWEQKGVPVRIEIGPRDLDKRSVRLCRRDNGEKVDVSAADLSTDLPALLETIQADMLARAKQARDDKIVQVTKWEDFVPALNKGYMALTPFCNEDPWEDTVKEKSREEALDGEAEDERTSTSVAAKTLCIPFDQPALAEGTPCFASGRPAQCWVLWGRSY